MPRLEPSSLVGVSNWARVLARCPVLTDWGSPSPTATYPTGALTTNKLRVRLK